MGTHVEPHGGPHGARMEQWRNVTCPASEPDADIARINAIEAEVGPFPAEVEHVRALISRFNSLAHYKALDNLTFILRAIGASDYPDMPAVDVLWRHERIDDERRATFKAYYHAVRAWLGGQSLEDATASADGRHEQTREVYAALGARDDAKVWLAESLAKTLATYALLPDDVIAEHGDAEYVRALYEAVLHRSPSGDDLRFRVAELSNGRTRDEIFADVLNAGEHTQHVRGHVAAILNRSAAR